MQAENREQDCLKCHANWQSKMAGVKFVNLNAVTPADCVGCHGGRAWYGEQTQK